MKFIVKRYWEMSEEIEVDANNKEQAWKQAMLTHLDEHSKGAQYVPDSLNIDVDTDVQEVK